MSRRYSPYVARQRREARRDILAGLAIAAAGLVPLGGLIGYIFYSAHCDGNLAWLLSKVLFGQGA